jgi:hypothetical protein
MKIEEYLLYRGKAAKVFPFEENNFTHITATAEPASEALSEKARYQINWPSIGAQDTKTTREFALALIAACEWVDAQERANG